MPVWLYGYQYEVLSQALCVPQSLQILGILVLAAGRLLGLAVEVRMSLRSIINSVIKTVLYHSCVSFADVVHLNACKIVTVG